MTKPLTPEEKRVAQQAIKDIGAIAKRMGIPFDRILQDATKKKK